jgi:hypothetical protein
VRGTENIILSVFSMIEKSDCMHVAEWIVVLEFNLEVYAARVRSETGQDKIKINNTHWRTLRAWAFDSI